MLRGPSTLSDSNARSHFFDFAPLIGLNHRRPSRVASRDVHRLLTLADQLFGS